MREELLASSPKPTVRPNRVGRLAMNYGKGWEGTHEEVALNIVCGRMFKEWYSEDYGMLTQRLPRYQCYEVANAINLATFKPATAVYYSRV